MLVLFQGFSLKLLPWFEPSPKAEPQPESKAETPANLTQQIAKRAHELYEERVSQDSGAVQDWEKAEREIRKDEPRK